MGKLKGPLFSLSASGQLAKTLVYFGWKGINVVREHVVPSNPNTALQSTQRAYVTAAVAMVHTAQARAVSPLNEDDQTANSTLATAKGKIMTWFNQAVKLWLVVKVAGKTPIVYSDGGMIDTHANDINLIIRLNEETGSDLAAGKFYFGRSKTNLIHSYAATINAGVSAAFVPEDMSDWIAVGDKIFWQFRPNSGDPCEGAHSGIYSFFAI